MQGEAARRLLVLDDEFLVATDLADLLEDAGYEIAGPALNVTDAMRIVRFDKIDGAVLDVVLKGELTFPVAASAMARGMPVLFVTANAAPYLVGAWAAVPRLDKPYQKRELLDGVRRLFVRSPEPRVA